MPTWTTSAEGPAGAPRPAHVLERSGGAAGARGSRPPRPQPRRSRATAAPERKQCQRSTGRPTGGATLCRSRRGTRCGPRAAPLRRRSARPAPPFSAVTRCRSRSVKCRRVRQPRSRRRRAGHLPATVRGWRPRPPLLRCRSRRPARPLATIPCRRLQRPRPPLAGDPATPAPQSAPDTSPAGGRTGAATGTPPAAPGARGRVWPAASRRAIPAAVRRLVWQRDQGRCCYRDPISGRRCTSAHLLQLDHLLPVAQGGGADPENLRLLCSAHHRQRHRGVPVTQPEGQVPGAATTPRRDR